MNAAKSTDWKINAMPEKRTKICLNRTFSPQEIEHIRMGHISVQMEDKWFIYWEDNYLHFHRSWTGDCIYIVHFEKEDENWKMIDAVVNRDPEQYLETSDERDAETISRLIDSFLLRPTFHEAESVRIIKSTPKPAISG